MVCCYSSPKFVEYWPYSFRKTVQYSVKLLVPLLQYRDRVRYGMGGRPTSTIEGLHKFAGHLSVARRVSGFWGMSPTFTPTSVPIYDVFWRWFLYCIGILAVLRAISALERSPNTSLTLRNLQRLQGISILLFYPLEYISFFSSPLAPVLHGVSPSMSQRAQIWSIRAWGAYVFLQILLLGEEWNELVRKENILTTDIDDVRDGGIKKRKQAIIYQLLANISRLPVIIHWCVSSYKLLPVSYAAFPFDSKVCCRWHL